MWGRGGALDMGSAPPPKDKLWIRPWLTDVSVAQPQSHMQMQSANSIIDVDFDSDSDLLAIVY